MHHCLLITLDAAEGDTSESVRRELFSTLLTDNTFCGTGGRFGNPRCDWFVIGGRWSGHLTESLLGEGYRRHLLEALPALNEPFCTREFARENAATLNRIWAEHGGRGPSPYLRNSYDCLGHEDDAMPLTRELYETVLRDYHGESEHDEYTDMESEALTEDTIGRKWLVVVDYHN